MSRSLIQSLAIVAIAIGGAIGARRGAIAPAVAGSRRASCAPNAASADRLLYWVRRTIADTGTRASSSRAGSGLPNTSADSARLVQVDSVCTPLAMAFARHAPSRDTVNPAPVYVVFVAPSVYVVTDFRPQGPPPYGVAADTVRFNTAAQWTDAGTFATDFSFVRMWKWAYMR